MAATAPAPKTAPRTAGGRRRAASGASPARRASARPAPARKPRRAPTRRPATRRPARRARQATPIPGRLVPVAVGRTATAVASLPDSGLVVRLTRGRLWIAALAVLLVGIVALNVLSLSLSSSSSQTARAVEELRREESALRAELAIEHSSRRVQNVAASLGLIVPEPGAIRYLRPSDGDAAEAARRLRSGELLALPATVPTTEAEVAVAMTAEPAAEEPVVPVDETPVDAPDPAPDAIADPVVPATGGRGDPAAGTAGDAATGGAVTGP